ncbi:MAG: hypothetical protein ACE5DM_00355 [Candidatus Nanoarchaeia archaeon]
MKVTPANKEIIDLEVEKSRLNREKSMLVMNKGLILYFAFMFIAVIGFINGYLNQTLLNVLIVMGLLVLIIGTVPYVKTMHEEEERLNTLIAELRKGR